MTTPITTDNRVLVGVYGDAYSAPAGTAPPTSIDNPAAPWTKLGLISEDGATWMPMEEETEDIHSWQHLYPERILSVSVTGTLAFALMEWDRVSIPFALGGGTFTEDAANDLTTYHPPGPGESQERALFLKVLDDPIKMGIYYGRGRILEREETTFKKDEAALLGVTFALLGESGQDPFQLIFGSENFPTGIVATGATAGTPGTFTPAGATPPENLAAMSGIVAAPATAWTTGQHVILGDASHAHWSSSAWVAGDA